MSATGLPCPHLIALFKACGHQPFPVQFIDPRWIPNLDVVLIPPSPELSIGEHDIMLGIASDAVSRGESDSEYDHDQSDDEASDDGEFVSFLPADIQPSLEFDAGQRRRFVTLLHLAKQIAQRGGESPELSEEIRTRLLEVLQSCTVAVGVEIRDAIDRPRG
jgi:hypothetical protein